MITNNKILTVSYGTFSCTLEGFDDSFGTMKAIAEYFRDLASDDRYFGAEPPQPDVEMLARIAQKEVSRRVEAREHEGKYVLSAIDEEPRTAPGAAIATGAALAGATAATALMQDEAPEAAPTDLSAGTTDTAAQPQTEEPAQQADAATAATDDRIEDAAADDLVDQETDLEVEGTTHTVEDVVEEPIEDVAEDQTAAALFVEDENDIVPGQPDAEVEAFFADNPTGTNQSDFEEIAELPAGIDTPIEAAADAGSDTIAAKLQRIRAVVAQQDDTAEDETYAEDEHAEEAADDLSDELADAAEDASAAANAVTAEAVDDTETEAVDDSTFDDDLHFEDLHAAPADAQIEDAAQDIDDVTAVVSEEVQDDVETAATADHDDEDDIADILSRLDQAEAAEAQAEADAEGNGDDTLISEDLSEADDDELLENLFDTEDVPSDDTSEDETPVAEDLAGARVTAYEASAEQRVDTKAPKTPAEEALAEAADTMAARKPRARVIKVKRADLDAAIKRGELEEYSDEAPKRPELDKHHLAPGKFGTSSLSAEDEAELARELAALEADIEMDQSTGEADAPTEDLSEAMTLSEDMRAEDNVTAAMEADSGAELDSEDWTEAAEEGQVDVPELDRAALDDAINAAHGVPEQQDAAPVAEAEEDDARSAAAATRRDAMPLPDKSRRGYMSRLLAETDQQMDEPEGATRRDAFAHLRAAVAAKKADDALGIEADTVEGDDAYRNDLADVVRPRRPGRSGARTPRPGEGGPAPLKLVAEQRIDTENSTAADPVRPRRVEAVDAETRIEGESFADFANDMGATTLPQQLEAAAAYMSFVEGREQFSRPQLMAKVRQVNAQDGFSREDGLRHFGQLLRAGKIEKVKGGRFTVSEDIGFRPDHRAAS